MFGRYLNALMYDRLCPDLLADLVIAIAFALTSWLI